MQINNYYVMEKTMLKFERGMEISFTVEGLHRETIHSLNRFLLMMAQHQGKVPAIKMARKVMNIGLKEAKEYVEDIIDSNTF